MPRFKIQSYHEECGHTMYQVVDTHLNEILDTCETLREAQTYLEGYERQEEAYNEHTA